MRSSRRYLFLVSSRAREARTLSRLRAVLADGRHLVPLAETASVGSVAEAAALLRRAAARDAIAVAAGGDGTVNLLVRALRACGLSDRPFGVLPLGTGNLLAHALGIPTPRRALQALEGGAVRALDLFVTTHPEISAALCSISVGFESRFIQRWGSRPGARRLAAMIPAALDAAPRSWTGVTIRADGAELVRPAERFYNAGLYNFPCYGFGRVVLPGADPGDGAGESVVCRSALAYWRMLAAGLSRRDGGGRGDPSWRRWRAVRIESVHPIQVDGEPAAAGAFEVRLQPAAVQVFVPSS